jgi:leucyl/phenylalanyl-tRNA---protein transferase
MKRKIVFPPIEEATEDGLVAIGGDLEVDTIETAYRQGIFPWPISIELPLAWFSPDPRGILEPQDFHVSRSFEKFLRKSPFKVTFNQDFNGVIMACARMYRKGQRDTWITPAIVKGYQNLFLSEEAYSVEVWNEDRLVGGLYGVCMGNFISGESMFMLEDNASKVALHYLIMHLKTRHVPFLDTQMVTPVVEQFGGKYIPRPEFLKRLQQVDWSGKRSLIFD